MTTQQTSVGERLENAARDFRLLQKELETLQTTKLQFLTQKNENEMVLKELEILEDDAVVYKLIGPSLIKNDNKEAISFVIKRLDLITRETERTEERMKDIQKQLEEKRNLVMQLQSSAK